MSLGWPETLVRRRLRDVSRRYLSMHPNHELFGNLYMEVYKYDAESRQEMPVDTATRIGSADLIGGEKYAEEYKRENRDPIPRPFSRPARDWPLASEGEPTLAMLTSFGEEAHALPPAQIVSFDKDKALLAQHLWMSGVSVEDIAAAVHTGASAVQSYLASRAMPRTVVKPGKAPVYLRNAVLAALPEKRDFEVYVGVHQREVRGFSVDVQFISPLPDILPDCGTIKQTPMGSYSRMNNDVSIEGVYIIRYVRMLEAVGEAVTLWYRSMHKKWRWFYVDIEANVLPEDIYIEEDSAQPVDLRPLRAPMMRLLDGCWEEPREPYGRKYLQVHLEEEPRVRFGGNPHQFNTESASRYVRKADAGEVVQLVNSIYQQSETKLENVTWSISIALENDQIYE